MIYPPKFQTERLLIEGWDAVPTIDEAQRILTSEALKDLPPSMTTDGSKASVRQWLAARRAESHISGVRLKADRVLIGFLILVPNQQDRVLHLGYLFAPKAWGQGFASELVQGLITALRSQTPITLRGGVAITNPASARVLEKAGLHQELGDHAPDTLTYSLTLKRP